MIVGLVTGSVLGVVIGLLVGMRNPTVAAATKRLLKDGETKLAAGVKKL